MQSSMIYGEFMIGTKQTQIKGMLCASVTATCLFPLDENFKNKVFEGSYETVMLSRLHVWNPQPSNWWNIIQAIVLAMP